MIEVFIAFTPGVNATKLERTLEAWNLPGLEPVAIQCGLKKFELHRRVTAENVSKGDYILADIDYGPLEEEFGVIAEKLLAENPDAGLLKPDLGSCTLKVHGTVDICRKGIITHWPTPQSASYDKEHSEAYQRVGFRTILCPMIHYHPLAESLPS